MVHEQSTPACPPPLSFADYLRREHNATTTHEYFDGRIIAKVGESAQHSLIVANTIRELGNGLKGKRCRVYDSNLRVRIPWSATCVHPDASVICGPAASDSEDVSQGIVTNPTAIVEVLSPLTERHDRGRKFRRYRMLESLKEYVLISHDEPDVETYRRSADGTWVFMLVSGIDAIARLRSLDIALQLSEVFANVEFPPQDQDDLIE